MSHKMSIADAMQLGMRIAAELDKAPLPVLDIVEAHIQKLKEAKIVKPVQRAARKARKAVDEATGAAGEVAP